MTVDMDALRATVAPLVAPLGLELYDVELTGSGRARVLRVSVYRVSVESDLISRVRLPNPSYFHFIVS